MSEAVSERNNLPNGWIKIRLGDHLELKYGKGISKRDRKPGTIPIYGSSGIIGYHNFALVKDCSIVVGRKGSAGSVQFIDRPCWPIDTTYFINKTNIYVLKFLYYLLVYLRLQNLDSSTAIPSLRRDDTYDIRIPLPPLNEQKRIVSKIESIFAQIDTKQQELEKLALQIRFVPDSFTELKGSILKKAFEGKLVPQDPDDEPVEAILKRIRRASEKELVFEKYDSPSGWIRVLLSDIAQINPPKPEKNSISDRLEVSFVPMRNVEALNGKIDLSETREYVKVRTGYTYFQNDDIIFAKITPCMENGKIAIVTGLKNGIGFGSTEFHVIRLKDEMLRKFYFLYFIQSDFRYNAQHKMKGTAGQLRVPSDYMKNILVPLPPLNEQKRIVAKIQSIFAQIDTKQQEP